MAWVAVGLSAASAISGLFGAKKQKKAAKTEQQAVRLQNARARQESIRQYRAARSAVLSGVIASGGDTRSSGYQGVKGSLQTQLQENASYSLQQDQLGQEANKYKEQSANYATIGQAFAVGANIATGASTLKQQPAPPTTTQTINSSPFRFYNDPGVRQ
jgi:hypothetical protein